MARDIPETTEEETYLFAPNEEHRPVVLLGAGASFSAGVPLAGRMVTEIAKWAYARKNRNTTPDRIQLRRSEWEGFLQDQPWYIKSAELSDLYPFAVRDLLVPSEFRRQFFKKIITDAKPTEGHRALARLCKRHLVSHFLTTNFDSLIENSLEAEVPHIREVTRITPLDYEAFSPNRKAQVIYLHGTVENYSDKNLPSETLTLDRKLLQRIHSLVEYSPIVVVGYRGSEQSIMEGLFEKGLEVSGRYRRGIYWCYRGLEQPHQNIIRLHERAGNNLRLVRIEGFDELFASIDKQLEGESLNPHLAGRTPALTNRARDSRPCPDKSLEDLDTVLLTAVLRDHYRRINSSDIRDLDAHLLEYDFASRHDEKIIPHFGLWLLFGNGVTEQLPHLKSILRIGNKEQRVIEGNLISQFNEIRQVLANDEINPMLRIKKSGAAEEKSAYHPRALVELLVNHFVHRDYAVEEPCEIQIVPGASITFKTVGGLPPRIRNQLSPDHTGRFLPRRGVREQRNPLLADVFYGIGLMDREGSGLVDVQKFALEHEGGAEFRIEGENSAVVLSLFRALSDPTGSGRTARARADKIAFVANMLRIHQLPKEVYSVPLKDPYAMKPRELNNSGMSFDAIPPIRTHSGLMIALQSLLPFSVEADKVANTNQENSSPMSTWIEDVDKRRVVVALLRKYWERFLG